MSDGELSDRDFDVVVVGAGPAGLAAACRAAECGRKVALLDDNPAGGGQIWRAAAGKPPAEALRWIQTAARYGVEWMPGARVFDALAPQQLGVEMFEGECRVGYGS